MNSGRPMAYEDLRHIIENPEIANQYGQIYPYCLCFKYSPDLKKYDLHGLWPKNTTPLPKKHYEISNLLPNAIKNEDDLLIHLPIYWNSDLHKSIGRGPIRQAQEYSNEVLKEANVRFWTHEWTKHGVCSPWECEDYFRKVMECYGRFADKLPTGHDAADMHHEIRIQLDENLNVIENKLNPEVPGAETP